jgi:hypothetical protein
MDKVQLQPGIYTNIFPVILPDDPVTFMEIQRAQATDLRELRNEIEQANQHIFVYAYKDRVYGYGQDASNVLSAKGFAKITVLLKQVPALAAHVVVQGIIDAALVKGFWQRRRMSLKDVEARTEIFRPTPKGITEQGKVKVFVGYELRCAYYPAVESFGLVVDVTWAYQDEHGVPLNPSQMRARNAMKEALVIQEEFLRGTNRLNLQIAQIRMHDYLLPFVREFQSIDLPCGGQAHLEPEPFPVILGG